jgi:hypothetical protein
MKLLWKLLIVAGVAALLCAFMMDTTVYSHGERFHNIGLQHDRTLLFVFGCLLILVGVVLFSVLKLKQPPGEERFEKQERVKKQEHYQSVLNAFIARFRVRPGARLLGGIFVIITFALVRFSDVPESLQYTIAVALALSPRPTVVAMRDLYAFCAIAGFVQTFMFRSTSGIEVAIYLVVVDVAAVLALVYFQSRSTRGPA